MPVYSGTNGNDSITGTAADDTIFGLAGNDTLVGGDGPDELYGGDGVDTLEGGAGNDWLDGGNQSDTARYSSATAGVTVSLMLTGQQDTVGAGLDTLLNIENLTGSSFSDTLTGSDTTNTLSGGGADDVLNGMGGADSLGGGAGNDILDGGDGSDTARYSEGPSYVDLTLTGQQNTGVGLDTLISIENLQGGSFMDYFAGNGDRNILTGLGGDDALAGRGGDDLLQGGTGNDYLGGGDGVDTASYTDIQQTVTVDLRLQGGGQDTFSGGYDTLEGIENLTGTNFGDLLTGDTGANFLVGSGGVDFLDGWDGDDLLQGGAGDDNLQGGLGVDTASYRETQSGVSVSLLLQGQGQNTGAAGVDTLNGMEGLEGSNFADTLTGDAGDNRFTGLGGDDVINGGEGEDTAIFGGAIADYRFDFADGVVTVTDTRLTGNQGVDTLTGIELFRFADGELTLGDLDNSPIVAAADQLQVTRGVASALPLAALLGNDDLNVSSQITGFGNLVDCTVSIVDGRLRILATGPTAAFDYTVTDGNGQTTTATVTVATLVSAATVDVLTADPAADAADLNGQAGHDQLTGGTGADHLAGGLGDDTLNGAGGGDILEGGAGNDTYLIGDPLAQIVELAGQGRDTVRATVNNVTLAANLEILILGDGVTNGTGNAEANTLIGNDLANVLDGKAGADRLEGGLGNDIYYVDDVLDRAYDTGGVDEVRSTANSFTLGANLDNLTFVGSGDFNGLGNTLANILTGGDGNDTLNGGTGANDRLVGGLGNDLYVVRKAGDVVVELSNQGADVIQTAVTYDLADNVFVETIIATGAGAVRLTGNNVTQTLIGNGANNILDGGSGDILRGEGGNDSYYLDGLSIQVIEDADEGYDTVYSTRNYVLGANIEKLVLQGVVIEGTGNAGVNLLVGNAANNILDGGAGADVLQGGLGNDLYYVDDAGDVVQESGVGTDTVRATALSYTLGALVENLLYWGNDSASFSGTGNTLANSITGGAGADTLDGGAGNDSLFGGSGQDTLIGGLGNDTLDGEWNTDTLIGGVGNDTYIVFLDDVVVEEAGGGIDTVRIRAAGEIVAPVTHTLAANVENLVLEYMMGVKAILHGNDLNNVITSGFSHGAELYGMGGDDRIYAATGNQFLYGGDGDDYLDNAGNYCTMEGGAGNDIYIASDGSSVHEDAGGGYDMIVFSGNGRGWSMPAEVEVLQYLSSIGFLGNANDSNNTLRLAEGNDEIYGLGGNDLMYGAAGEDALYGGQGNDRLMGEEGDDYLYEEAGSNTLIGGAGADEMWGGSGRDVFQYTAVAESTSSQRDEIVRFSGTDVIDLRAIDADTATSGDQAFAFIGAAAFSGVGGQLRYEVSGGNILVQGDVNGDGTADLEILVYNLASIEARGFLL